ncbi:hypothetical protein CYMTET_14253 [Cymbomonas tetramitiformis]|uniref:Uncharacterized protein n=1 Tax=Cymbomonas tetramitiformis TaxID=36881 RepID=A0AAE0GGF6_9CHLO|nr:hypothetical protein CYMTET_14253 [Cymbomonas tetramitiformis]
MPGRVWCSRSSVDRVSSTAAARYSYREGRRTSPGELRIRIPPDAPSESSPSTPSSMPRSCPALLEDASAPTGGGSLPASPIRLQESPSRPLRPGPFARSSLVSSLPASPAMAQGPRTPQRGSRGPGHVVASEVTASMQALHMAALGGARSPSALRRSRGDHGDPLAAEMALPSMSPAADEGMGEPATP